MGTGALAHIRICDFTGQLAGAGSTKWMAAFGAEVIRIEDPVTKGMWDIVRAMGPYKPGLHSSDASGAFNNHNVGKYGITLNLRTARAKELLRELIATSDVVTENFAAGVLERMGFGFAELQAIKPDIIYVSNCGFGQVGPYRSFKTWGPIVQACCGLAFGSGLPDLEPAGYGFSYMDHHGASYMAMAILSAVLYRNRTGKGQWIDMSCTEAGAAMLGPVVLDGTANGRPLRRDGMPDSNRSQYAAMAPHGIYRCEDTGVAHGDPAGDDNWVAVACADDAAWQRFAQAAGIDDPRFADLAGRLAHEDELDAAVTTWTRQQDRHAVAQQLQQLGVAAAVVARPVDRIDNDPNAEAWGLWPTIRHTLMGDVRVDGLPVHLSRTDWTMERGGPVLGEHNHEIYQRIFGLSLQETDALRAEGVL